MGCRTEVVRAYLGGLPLGQASGPNLTVEFPIIDDRKLELTAYVSTYSTVFYRPVIRCTANIQAGVPCRLNRLFGQLWSKVRVLWGGENHAKSLVTTLGC